jgi:hypothetical protein
LTERIVSFASHDIRPQSDFNVCSVKAGVRATTIRAVRTRLDGESIAFPTALVSIAARPAPRTHTREPTAGATSRNAAHRRNTACDRGESARRLRRRVHRARTHRGQEGDIVARRY